MYHVISRFLSLSRSDLERNAAQHARPVAVAHRDLRERHRAARRPARRRRDLLAALGGDDERIAAAAARRDAGAAVGGDAVLVGLLRQLVRVRSQPLDRRERALDLRARATRR